MKEFMKKNFKYIIYMGMLFIIGIAFFFYLGKQGYIIEKDSGVFLNADKYLPYQYVIYPKFLELCKKVFGENQYLEWVSNIQGIISLCVSVLTTEYFRKNFKLSCKWGVLVFICTFGPYAYSLPQYVSSHSILTEGLAFPLFYLWMILALEIYLHKKNMYFLPLLIVTVFMMYTRTQLMLFIVVDVLMMVERVFQYVFHKLTLRQKVFWTKSSVFGGVIVLFIGIKLFLFFIENNFIPQMTDAVAGRVFCAVEKDDVNLFEEKDRELFEDIFEEIEARESRQSYFRDGIRQWEDIAYATNENTKMLVTVIKPHYAGVEVKELNGVKGKLAYVMMLEHWDDYLFMTMVLMLQSLVVSIFVHPESAYLLGFMVAIALYLLAILFAILCKRRYYVEQEYLTPLVLTLFVIFSICGFTNILFMGLQRYVVYPFGFFYISLIVLFNGFLKNYK